MCVCVCDVVIQGDGGTEEAEAGEEARTEEGVVGVGELGEDEDGHGCVYVCVLV